MFQYYFQIYFILVICTFIKVNCGILYEHETTESNILSSVEPRRKCGPTSCTCADFPQWDGVICKHDDRLYFPIIGIWRFKYLPEKMFEGLLVYGVYLWDPDATVDENVLEGCLGLQRFVVNQSSIQVICLIILKVIQKLSSFTTFSFFSL